MHFGRSAKGGEVPAGPVALYANCLRKTCLETCSAVLHCTGRDIQAREPVLKFNQDGRVWELRSDSAVGDPVPSEEVLEHLLVWLREAGSFSGTAEGLSTTLRQRCGVLYSGNVLTRKMRRSWNAMGSSAGSAGRMTALSWSAFGCVGDDGNFCGW